MKKNFETKSTDRKMPNLKSLEMKKFEHKRIEIDGDEYVQFSGYLSTFGNVDQQRDVVVRGAFRNSLKKRMPKMLWQHDYEHPVGRFEKCYEDEKGLYVEGLLPLDDDLVRGKIYPQMKVGSITAMSIGYGVEEARWDMDENVRYLYELELWEGSFVTFPANELAEIELMKQKQYKAVAEKMQTIESGIKYADGYAEIEYKWNPEEAGKRVSEKLQKPIGQPLCDVIDGKIKIIPRALFCMKAKICGAKGGIDKEKTEQMKELINKHYEKMDMEAPFEANTDENTIVSYTLKEIENMPVSETSYVLRSKNCRLTKSAADMIATKINSEAITSDENGGDSSEEFDNYDTAEATKIMDKWIEETKKGDYNA